MKPEERKIGIIIAVIAGIILIYLLTKSSGGQDVPQVEANEEFSGNLYDPVDDAILASGGETIPEEDDTTLDSGPADDEAEAEAEAEESDTVEGYRLF
jgi:hypothetical protein|tara:strand:+ start:1572 stop:1865 length:294 start_codon:yes stop_codon:yes gene_type:complete